MRVTIAAIGRMKSGPERELVGRYLQRAAAAGKSLGLTGFSVMEQVESRAATPANRKLEEGKELRLLAGAGVLVALDEHGTQLDSPGFAGRLGRWRDEGQGQVSFVIGGPDGLDPDFLRSATLVLSFSALTWPHQLVRIMLAEQLYRTTTILSGHPYHRGD